MAGQIVQSKKILFDVKKTPKLWFTDNIRSNFYRFKTKNEIKKEKPLPTFPRTSPSQFHLKKTIIQTLKKTNVPTSPTTLANQHKFQKK